MGGEFNSLKPFTEKVRLKLTQFSAQDSCNIRDGELIFRFMKKELLDSAVLTKCISFRGRVDYHDLIQENISTLLDLIKSVNQSITFILSFAKTEKTFLHSLHVTVTASLHLLRSVYQLCKDTLESKDDAVKKLSTNLNVLFRHGFTLQCSVVNLIDHLLQSDVEDIPVTLSGSVSEALCSLAALVQCLDPRALLSIWKTLSRLAALSRSGDFHLLLSTLCSNIDNQTKQCFSARRNSEGQSVEFANSVKLAAFLAKVLVNLLAMPSAVAMETGAAEALCLFLLRFHEYTMRSDSLPPHEASELHARLFFVSDIVVEKLIAKEEFSAAVFAIKPDLMAASQTYLLSKILFFFSSCEGISDHQIGQLWLRPKENIFDKLFECLSHCVKEIRCRRSSFRTNFSAACDIYSFALLSASTALCVLNQRLFQAAERSICVAALGHRQALCRQFAADLWCFVCRYGNAELCRAHLQLLASLSAASPAALSRRAARLFARLCPLAREAHQAELLTDRPLLLHPRLWRALRLDRLAPSAERAAAQQVSAVVGEQLVRLRAEDAVTLSAPDLDLLTSALTAGRSSKVALDAEPLAAFAARVADLVIGAGGELSGGGERRLVGATCRLLKARLSASNAPVLLPACERFSRAERPPATVLFLLSALLGVLPAGSAPESLLACLVRGLSSPDPRAVFAAAQGAAVLAKSGADDRILRLVAAESLARSRFEQIVRVTEPLPSDELSLLLDVLPQPTEAERPRSKRKRLRSPEAETEAENEAGAPIEADQPPPSLPPTPQKWEKTLARLENALTDLESVTEPFSETITHRLAGALTRLRCLCKK